MSTRRFFEIRQVPLAPVDNHDDSLAPVPRDRRNGIPGLVPYTWRPGDAERDAWVAARVRAAQAAVRAAHGVADEMPPRIHAPVPGPFDAYGAAEAREFALLPGHGDAGYCEDCGYRLGARGHRTECGGAP
jgi:hypothetical protein